MIYYKAMLNDDVKFTELAARMREAIGSLERGGRSHIATVLDVSPQAVTGWIRTGKISKENLAAVAEITGYSLAWLTTGNGYKLAQKSTLSNAENNIENTAENYLYPHENIITPDSHFKQTRLPKTTWSVFCIDNHSKKIKVESLTMLLEKEIQTTAGSFWLEIDCDIFTGIAVGSLLLIEPNNTPNPRNTVVISFEGEPKTLAKYHRIGGGQHIETLEDGHIKTVSLDGKQYTIHGVVVWVQPPGYAP